MDVEYATIIIIFEIFKLCSVNTSEFHNHNRNNNARYNYISPLQLSLKYPKKICSMNGKFVECSHKDLKIFNKTVAKNEALHINEKNIVDSLFSTAQPVFRGPIAPISTGSIKVIQGSLRPRNMLPVQYAEDRISNFRNSPTWSALHEQSISGVAPSWNTFNRLVHDKLPIKSKLGTDVKEILKKFVCSLDYFERKFYKATFTKLISMSPDERRTNGMSFVQSGFLLQLTLLALSLEVDPLTKEEIKRSIQLHTSDMETIIIIRGLISSLPDSSEKLKLRHASQLMLWPGNEISMRFRDGGAAALRLGIDIFNGTETSKEIITVLNRKAEFLSAGAIRNTFDEEDISGEVTAVIMTIMYFRARWRSAPTLLNGTRSFRDADLVRPIRMIRINDIIGYTDIREWNAEALEIPYSYPELSLVIILPRTASLRRLADNVISTSIRNITSRIKRKRIAVTLPLYTLRMTLLLPNKLQAMGVSRLFDVSNRKPSDTLRLSHMVQRLMFWSEAGRNAFKDDGLEWDEKPEMEILVDRPYIFYVRWRHLTLLNGNFVL